jgi:predicted O-methyltransferase YrrM
VHPDGVLTGDANGKLGTAIRAIRGADEVARFLFVWPTVTVRPGPEIECDHVLRRLADLGPMAATDATRTRRVKDWGKARLRTVFEVGQRFGVDVLPRHFYSAIPDIRALKRDRRWQRPYSMVGVAGADIEQQLSWLREICPPELAATLPSFALQERAAEANGAVGYGPIEADLLYCFVRTRAPRRIIQVGAGASTWVALRAAQDAGDDVDITCVDPFPTDYLKRLRASGLINLRDVPVQALAASELASLGPGDLLFVDSTHTVSPGSDVNFLILEILPRLAKGVFVHFHDVTMPYDYMPVLLTGDLFFWSESVLLHAYLADNPRFEIRLGCAMLHDMALERVQEILPTYDNAMKTDRGIVVGNPKGAFPSSMWLEVVADPTGQDARLMAAGARTSARA